MDELGAPPGLSAHSHRGCWPTVSTSTTRATFPSDTIRTATGRKRVSVLARTWRSACLG